jgi:tellurite resistance protein TerC
MPWLWITFIATIILLVLLDLYVWHRGHTRPSRRNEFTTAALYVLLAIALGGVIHLIYERHYFGMGLSSEGSIRLTGRDAAAQFVTLALWQVALDLDGVFVVSALFTHLAVPQAVRHRILFWGIFPAMLVRGLLIGAGLSVLNAPSLEWWARYLLAGLLVLAALRMLILRQENFDPSRNYILAFLRRFVHISERFDGHSLLTRQAGRLAATPLLVALVLLSTADLWIALDSTPALLALSDEPFLLFASSATALLCLRSVYAALEDLRGWLRCVKIGLASMLAYAAILMALPRADHPEIGWSLLLLGASIGAGSVFALRPGAKFAEGESPIGEQAEWAARMALRKARQGITLVVGTSLLVIGLIMIPAPGPGLVVVFVALAILGNEFAWARELTSKYRKLAVRAAAESAAAARKRFSPWLLLLLMLATVAIFVAAHYRLHLQPRGLVIAAIPVLLGQAIWGWITWGKQRRSPVNESPTKQS